LRISTLPSTYGERVVIRLLDPRGSSHLLTFAALGMPEKVEKLYKANVAKTSGIVLSTGPTGSGKTTTLYTTLAWVTTTNAGGSARGCELNIMTVEDPVEYDL
ncbi:MAG: Flp pilus assembly complex ATPase component TadA, partial [Nitrospira sp.]|nr:Flp pilus assembly complex ATPase component TadA [Nitrospira sp.]